MKKWLYSEIAKPWSNGIKLFALFFLVFLGVNLFLGQHKVLEYPPQGIHLWRQADGLTFTYNYYKDGIPVFHPRLNNLHCDGGYEACEFPLVYVMVAALYKIFGPHTCIFRLVTLLFVFMGFYSLYRTLSLLLNDMWQGLALSLIFFASSILVYYSSSFLPDPVALGFILTGWWFFFRYTHFQQKKDLCLSFLFFTIGSLIKVTYGLNPLVVVGLFFTEKIWKIRLKKEGTYFPHNRLYIVLGLASAVLVFLWNNWMLRYNFMHHSNYFTTSARPIWEASPVSVAYTWQLITEYWYTKYYYESIFHFFLLILIAGLYWIRLSGRLLLFTSGYIILGGLTYFLLFYQQFADHDYYMINMMCVVLFPVTTSFLALKQRFPKVFSTWYVTLVLLLLAFLGIQYAGLNLHRRYDPEQIAASHFNTGFYSIQPLLSAAGIPKEARIISVPDPSPNISLYFLDRQGWTVSAGYPRMQDTVSYLMRRGADYLLISDPSLLKRTDLQAFLSNKVLEHKGITLYKL